MDRFRRKKMAFLLILLIQATVILWFGFQKKGYFIDEIYSFGLSNGYYKPFVTSYGDQIFDQWSERSILDDYMTVQKGEQFAYGSVLYNQAQDVHPPLYYMILHAVSSFFPDQYSKWFGISINLICALVCSILIWSIGDELFHKRWTALLPVIIWGFSAGAVSYVIYIRMYMLMTLFTLLTVWLHVRMFRQGQTPKRLAGIFLATVCGILTQYYFVIFAFYTSAIYCLFKLCKREWKVFAVYAGVLLSAVGSSVLLFPASITQLTRDQEFVASETRKNLESFANLKNNLLSYLYGINTDFFAGLYWVVLLFIAALALGMLLYRILKKERLNMGKMPADDNAASAQAVLLLLFSCLLSILTIAVVAVVPSPRYICSMYPVLVLCGVWLLEYLIRWMIPGYSKLPLLLAAALFLLFSVRSYQRGMVQYLYQDEPERLATADRYSDLSSLYVTNYRVAGLTADVRIISCFKENYITSEEKLDHIQDILKDRDVSSGLVVTVDNNAYWGSGYDPGQILNKIFEKTEFTQYECLFAQEFSATYLIK